MDISEQIKCIKREIGMRKRVYPRWVENGNMTKEKAEHELAAMSAVLETLQSLEPASEDMFSVKPDRSEK